MFLRGPTRGSKYPASILCARTALKYSIQWSSENPLQHWHPAPSSHRLSSSSSSKRWQARQGRDRFSIDAKVQGLKSRAAFKLLEINEKYHLFRRGQTVVDLGYAPGSWSQVAVDRTYPNGRVLGIDIIPAKPPKGVSTIQGNFLSPGVQEEVKKYLRDSDRGRIRQELSMLGAEDGEASMTEDDLEETSRSYLELEKRAESAGKGQEQEGKKTIRKGKESEDEEKGRMVDVVLSDMMMNTSGMSFRDHAGSMDLCNAALSFTFDTLRTGGHFVCKFYQGAEDKALEGKLKELFKKVHREKPESSRSESKEAYFVALRRKGDAKKEAVWKDSWYVFVQCSYPSPD
ncbi:hypothetical protein N7G274_002850 [Stereocaulon virgatum]|uniref:rRNA methyltransferase 2, mitochondrial n=1 Tax=Stereocaulon virgatum TaxID=373712 RepID=A0ABR4AIT2_9LECA